MNKNSNKVIRKELEEMYGKECMFTLSKNNLTFHHIQKKELRGSNTAKNGAIIINLGQDWLHCYIERKDPELFDLINECLLLYKICMDSNNIELLKQYRDEIVPAYIEAIKEYANQKQKVLTL